MKVVTEIIDGNERAFRRTGNCREMKQSSDPPIGASANGQGWFDFGSISSTVIVCPAT